MLQHISNPVQLEILKNKQFWQVNVVCWSKDVLGIPGHCPLGLQRGSPALIGSCSCEDKDKFLELSLFLPAPGNVQNPLWNR